MRRGPLRSAELRMKVQYQRHLALGLAVTVACTGLLVLRQWLPDRAAVIGTIPTGASFSLIVARYRSTQEANAVAANVQSVGLPAFTRSLKNGVRQVIVGPYVSIDEAESAQRLLARRGFGRARMLVDESVRRTPGVEGVALITASHRAGPAEGGPAVVAVAAAGRLSVVIELPSEPRHVETRRPEGTVLEVDAGPVTTAIAAQAWNAPDGVDLINGVSVEKHEGPGGTTLRTRVTMPAFTQSNVRVVGRRVYIDVWAPPARGDQPVRASRSVPVVEDDEEEDVPAVNSEDAYRDAIGPVVARVGEIEPFLMSAVASPSPEVLAAIGKTLAAVQEWIGTIEAPTASASTHDSLIESIRMAVHAVEPEFAGDRSASARAALDQFEATAVSYQLSVVRGPRVGLLPSDN